MGKALDIINNVLVSGFLLAGAIELIVNLYSPVPIPLGFGSGGSIICAFSSIVASLVFSYILREMKINKNFMILINIGLWANLAGEMVFFYTSFIYYDKILHALLGFLIAAILSSYFKENLKFRRIITFFTALGITVLWEIYEYLNFSFTNYPLVGVLSKGVIIQTPYDDTMYDLIIGAIGISLYLLLIGNKKTKRENRN